jgi:hypothetical protein
MNADGGGAEGPATVSPGPDANAGDDGGRR